MGALQYVLVGYVASVVFQHSGHFSPHPHLFPPPLYNTDMSSECSRLPQSSPKSIGCFYYRSCVRETVISHMSGSPIHRSYNSSHPNPPDMVSCVYTCHLSVVSNHITISLVTGDGWSPCPNLSIPDKNSITHLPFFLGPLPLSLCFSKIGALGRFLFVGSGW